MCADSLKIKRPLFQVVKGGEVPTSALHINIKPISNNECFEFTRKYHYSKTTPRLTKICLGGYVDNNLVAVMSLGWGVRPLHTIAKMFPSYTSKNYYEIGRMCIDDMMPKNTGSIFLSQIIKWLRVNTDIDVLFTWSDGIMGKPGYVYQASNFYYGGYIWTDVYFTEDGEKVHPRQTNKIGGRPKKEFIFANKWKHIRGKQFRYIYFLNDKSKSDTVWKWTKNNMPKEKDLEYKELTPSGWVFCGKPFYNRESMSFRSSKKDTLL